MTPTLFGRWQTRILLFLTVGILLTIPFELAVEGPFTEILIYVMILGLFWDCLYTFIQKFRWDRDWPAAFQVAAGVVEVLFLLLLIEWEQVPEISTSNFGFSYFWFFFHYSVVWLGIFIASQVLMRLVFPRWRFRGGRWF